MKTNPIWTVVLAIVAMSVVAAAGDEEHLRRLEEEKHAVMRRAEEMKMRIDRLRTQALEHEAQARALQAEAAHLELRLRDEMAGHKAHFERAETKEKIAHLLEQAKIAQREGRREEAMRLLTEALELKNDVPQAIVGPYHRAHAEEMERKLDAMRREADELERKGHHDEAHEIRAHAEAMARQLRAPAEGEDHPNPEELHHRMLELREASEIAEREGKIDKARRLWAEAEELEALLHHLHAKSREPAEHPAARERERREGQERPAMQRQIDELYAQIAELRELVEHLKRKPAKR